MKYFEKHIVNVANTLWEYAEAYRTGEFIKTNDLKTLVFLDKHWTPEMIASWLMEDIPEEKKKEHKYKLTQFENDLLIACFNDIAYIGDSQMLLNLKEQGYFKDIPENVGLYIILNGCEIVEE